jgi:hypothetical protein
LGSNEISCRKVAAIRFFATTVCVSFTCPRSSTRKMFAPFVKGTVKVRQGLTTLALLRQEEEEKEEEEGGEGYEGEKEEDKPRKNVSVLYLCSDLVGACKVYFGNTRLHGEHFCNISHLQVGTGRHSMSYKSNESRVRLLTHSLSMLQSLKSSFDFSSPVALALATLFFNSLMTPFGGILRFSSQIFTNASRILQV